MGSAGARRGLEAEWHAPTLPEREHLMGGIRRRGAGPPPPPPVIVAMPPPEPPIEIYYPVPVYTGVVVINPPDRDAKSKQRQPSAPGPPPVSNPSSRTIAERPRTAKPVEPKPPSAPRGDDSPREHRLPTPTLPHTEPVRTPSPPPPH